MANNDYRNALDQANARLEAARSAVAAARVPDDDIDTGSSQPVTVGGWYDQRTISGRPAWRHCRWVAGQLRTDAPTYDRAAHAALDEAAREHYDARRAYDDQREVSR